MAQVFLHGLDVVPCSKGIDRVSVTQVVDADVWHTEAFYDLLEAIIQGAKGNVASKLIGKDKVVLVVPCASDVFPPLGL